MDIKTLKTQRLSKIRSPLEGMGIKSRNIHVPFSNPKNFLRGYIDAKMSVYDRNRQIRQKAFSEIQDAAGIMERVLKKIENGFQASVDVPIQGENSNRLAVTETRLHFPDLITFHGLEDDFRYGMTILGAKDAAFRKLQIDSSLFTAYDATQSERRALYEKLDPEANAKLAKADALLKVTRPEIEILGDNIVNMYRSLSKKSLDKRFSRIVHITSTIKTLSLDHVLGCMAHSKDDMRDKMSDLLLNAAASFEREIDTILETDVYKTAKGRWMPVRSIRAERYELPVFLAEHNTGTHVMLPVPTRQGFLTRYFLEGVKRSLGNRVYSLASTDCSKSYIANLGVYPKDITEGLTDLSDEMKRISGVSIKPRVVAAPVPLPR